MILLRSQSFNLRSSHQYASQQGNRHQCRRAHSTCCMPATGNVLVRQLVKCCQRAPAVMTKAIPVLVTSLLHSELHTHTAIGGLAVRWQSIAVISPSDEQNLEVLAGWLQVISAMKSATGPKPATHHSESCKGTAPSIHCSTPTQASLLDASQQLRRQPTPALQPASSSAACPSAQACVSPPVQPLHGQTQDAEVAQRHLLQACASTCVPPLPGPICAGPGQPEAPGGDTSAQSIAGSAPAVGSDSCPEERTIPDLDACCRGCLISDLSRDATIPPAVPSDLSVGQAKSDPAEGPCVSHPAAAQEAASQHMIIQDDAAPNLSVGLSAEQASTGSAEGTRVSDPAAAQRMRMQGDDAVNPLAGNARVLPCPTSAMQPVEVPLAARQEVDGHEAISSSSPQRSGDWGRDVDMAHAAAISDGLLPVGITTYNGVSGLPRLDVLHVRSPSVGPCPIESNFRVGCSHSQPTISSRIIWSSTGS